jgi:hypothetical protein
MTKKKSNSNVYLLLILVVVIWGWLGYRFFSSKIGSDNPAVVELEKNQQALNLRKRKEYDLYLDYPDPFASKHGSKVVMSDMEGLDSFYSEGTPSSVSGGEPLGTNKEVDKILNTPLPAIKYVGLFSNTTKSKKIGIIEIGSKKYIVEEGQIVEGVEVLKISADSLQCSFESVHLIITNKN